MTFWMLLLAVTMPLEVGVVGRLMAAEILCVALVAWAILAGRSPPLHSAGRAFYILASVWLLAQIATDLHVGSETQDFLRGSARIVFFMIDFTAVRIITRNNLDRAMLFLVVVLIGAAAKFYLGTGNLEKTGEFHLDWKFGYGQAFTITALFVGAWLSALARTNIAGSALGFAAAVFNLFLNARSLFGQTAFAAFVGTILSMRRKARIGTRTLALLGVLALGGGFGAVQIYSYAASEGLLGQGAKEKYERQANSDLGLLFGGRTELLGSLDAIADSPIIGYGSYGRDIRYAELRLLRLQQAGMATSRDVDSDRIPTHSFLFGAWVEAGLPGSLLWFWVLFATARGMLAAAKHPGPYTSLIIFAGIALAWDVLFSPFGLDRRIVTPALLNIMLLVAARAAGSSSAPTRPPPAPWRRRIAPRAPEPLADRR